MIDISKIFTAPLADNRDDGGEATADDDAMLHIINEKDDSSYETELIPSYSLHDDSKDQPLIKQELKIYENAAFRQWSKNADDDNDDGVIDDGEMVACSCNKDSREENQGIYSGSR